MENRNGLIAAAMTTQADGRAERDAALLMLHELSRKRGGRITTGADKAYDTRDFVSTVRELGVTPHVARRLARCDRRTNQSASRVRDQFKQTLVGGETVRMAEADWPPEESKTTRTGEGGLAVRVQLCCLQLDPHPETASAERVKPLSNPRLPSTSSRAAEKQQQPCSARDHKMIRSLHEG